ncbi:TPA: hypothetical protein ACIRVD_003883 [Enterobacter roggenkampii]
MTPANENAVRAACRTCIASMGRFQHEFEPLTKAQAERIAGEIETADHLKKLRAQHAA